MLKLAETVFLSRIRQHYSLQLLMQEMLKSILWQMLKIYLQTKLWVQQIFRLHSNLQTENTTKHITIIQQDKNIYEFRSLTCS